MLEIHNYFTVKDFVLFFFSFHLMKSFPILALREIKHIQLNYATYRQKQSKRETLCWLNFTVAIGNRQVWKTAKSSLRLSIMPQRQGISWDCSFFPSLFACMLCVSSQALQIAEKDRIKVGTPHTSKRGEKL